MPTGCGVAEYRQAQSMPVVSINIDTTEITACLRSIRSLFESRPLKEIPQSIRDPLKNLLLGGGLDVCITPFSTASVTGHHVIGLRVGGVLKEIAAAAAAMQLGSGFDHSHG